MNGFTIGYGNVSTPTARRTKNTNNYTYTSNMANEGVSEETEKIVGVLFPIGYQSNSDLRSLIKGNVWAILKSI